MASTRPSTLAGTHGDAHRNALLDRRGDTPGTRRTNASDDTMADADLDDDSLDALLRDEFLIADELDDAEAFTENVPDAALFLPFRDGRPSWR